MLASVYLCLFTFQLAVLTIGWLIGRHTPPIRRLCRSLFLILLVQFALPVAIFLMASLFLMGWPPPPSSDALGAHPIWYVLPTFPFVFTLQLCGIGISLVVLFRIFQPRNHQPPQHISRADSSRLP
jgi:hypothetical protein